MTARWRLALCCLALVVLIPAVWHVAAALPPFGYPISLYGQTVNVVAPALRNVSNMVAVVNFDVRGIDTLGEECMLLCAVTGAVVLLRGGRGEDRTERAGRVPGRGVNDRADATVLVCRTMATIMLLFGIYVTLHGTATPGGGFQGGVIAASGLLLIYLGDGYEAWRRTVHSPAFALLEGGGALLFVACAGLPLVRGHAALENLLPLGTWKDVFAGGTMVVVNFAVALSVTGSFTILLVEFLEETRAAPDGPVADEED